MLKLNIEKEIAMVEEMANELGLEIYDIKHHKSIKFNKIRFLFMNTSLYVVLHTETDAHGNLYSEDDVKYSVRSITDIDVLVNGDTCKLLNYIKLNHKLFKMFDV